MLQEISRTKDQAVTFSLPIAKVDKATRTVKGIASQECVDAHGQIVDYEFLKACLPAYKNNIREMHQPKAVGKAIAIECDDVAKAVIVESYISKGAEDTWTKVEEGILTSYSIGGMGDVVVGKNADGKTETRIFMSSLTEVSLVDAPACPTATFEIVKMVAGVPTDVRPAEPEPAADTEAVTKTVAVRKRLWESYDIERALAVLSLLQGIISSEIDDLIWGDPVADGDVEGAAQLDTLRLAAQLVFDFLASEFDSQFTALEARLTAIGKLAGPGADAIRKALGEPGIAKALKAIDKALAQKMHDNSVHLGAACGETMEKTIDTPAGDSVVEKAGEVAASTALIAVEQLRVNTEKQIGELQAKVASLETENDALKKRAEEADAKIAESTANLTKGHEELKATTEESIARLDGEVVKLANSPAPGGPVRTAPAGDGVVKTLAGQGAADTAPEAAAQLVQLATELAPQMTPQQRDEAVKKVIGAQLLIGRMDMQR